MVLLVTLAFSLVPGIFAKVRTQKGSHLPIFVTLNFLLIGWVLVTALTSTTNSTQSFFGVSGRFTGALTYVSFSLIAIATFFVATKQVINKVLAGLAISGIFNLIYCALVILTKNDPIPWTNIYGNILGTFGNPNFISSFLGIFNIVVFAKILDRSLTKLMTIAAFTLIVISTLEIIDSQSRQGLIVTALGCGAALIYRIFQSSLSLMVKLTGLIGYFLAGVFAVLGMLQIGPLTTLIYKLSVSIRGAYWRAGWETMLQNPIFGAGPDSFGDWYARVRDARAMLVPGPDVFTNSPHNVFIEQGSNGGIPLFVIYLTTQIYILTCGLRFLKNSSSFSYIFAASFFGWLGFTAQSLISINQIGLAVWGYVLGAMTVSIYLHSRKIEAEFSPKLNRNKENKNEFTNILAFGGAAVGLILAVPPFYAEANWRTSLSSKNFDQIVKAADKWPQSTERYIQVSKALYENKFDAKSLEFVRKGLEFNPSNARLWYFLYQLPGSTEIEKETAKTKLKVLDPNFVVK